MSLGTDEPEQDKAVLLYMYSLINCPGQLSRSSQVLVVPHVRKTEFGIPFISRHNRADRQGMVFESPFSPLQGQEDTIPPLA